VIIIFSVEEHYITCQVHAHTHSRTHARTNTNMHIHLGALDRDDVVLCLLTDP